MPRPWWKSSNSPSSTSSASSSPRFIFNCSSRAYVTAAVHPRLTRQRKLRHLADADLSPTSASTPGSRSPSNLEVAPRESSSTSLPLPLPGNSSPTVGRRYGGFRLPSPTEGGGGGGRGEEEERVWLPEQVAERLTHQAAHKSPERVAAQSGKSMFSHYRKALHDPNSVESENFRLHIPAKSAPASGFSSPARSPKRISNVDYVTSSYNFPQGLQGWPSPEAHSKDLIAGLSTQTSPKEISPDCLSPYSPTSMSPVRSRNPSAPPSPRHSKIHPENSATFHDNNSNASFHPLPLPPGPAVPLQSSSSHPNMTKPEPSRWQKQNLIGSGSFGNVYVAANRHTGALCAMKEVNIIPDDPKSAECLKQLEQEIKVLSQLKHPNIVQYYGCEMTEDRFYIYLEYVHPGSINKYVRDHCGAMTESVVRNFTWHILKGLAYLHGSKTIHRDIKGANLLVDVNGVVKLADFGTAKHLSGAGGALSLKGTPYWMAPEVTGLLGTIGTVDVMNWLLASSINTIAVELKALHFPDCVVQATMNNDISYDYAVDIWSLGCTIIEMFTGKHPWTGLGGPAAMFKVLHKDPSIPDALSSEGKDFLRRCFRRNPSDRPTAMMLLEHPFIRNSHHHKIHGSIHAFAGIQIVDNTNSPRDQAKAKSETQLKAKQLSNVETRHTAPEISESAASRIHTHSMPGRVPNSFARAHHASRSPSGPTNISNGVHPAARNHQPYVLPKPYGNEVLNFR